MFEGLSAFPTTPTDAEGEIDASALAHILNRLSEAGVDSVGLLGSTGGYTYLTREQRRRAVEVAQDVLGTKVPLLVGIGALRTDHTQQLARDAEAAGANAVLLAPVSYQPLTEDEVYHHFVAVAAATGLPVVIYNNPTTTKFSFSNTLIQRLAKIPTISAVKMPLPNGISFEDQITLLRADTPSDFSIGYSGDWGARDALAAGADVWYSVIGGLLPKPALALTRAAMAGNHAEATRLNASFEPLWAMFKEFGSFRVMYALGSALGLFESDPPLPILPIPTSAKARIEAVLSRLDA